MLCTAPQRPRLPCAGWGESGPALPDCCRCGWPNFSESDHVKRDFGDSPAMVLIPGLLKQESLSDADIKNSLKTKSLQNCLATAARQSRAKFSPPARGASGPVQVCPSISDSDEACFGAGSAAWADLNRTGHHSVNTPAQLNTVRQKSGKLARYLFCDPTPDHHAENL